MYLIRTWSNLHQNIYRLNCHNSYLLAQKRCFTSMKAVFFCFLAKKKWGQSGAFSNGPSCFHVNRGRNRLTTIPNSLLECLYSRFFNSDSSAKYASIINWVSRDTFWTILRRNITHSLNLSLKSLHSCSAQQLVVWCGKYSPFNTLNCLPILNLEWQFSLNLNFKSFPGVAQPV